SKRGHNDRNVFNSTSEASKEGFDNEFLRNVSAIPMLSYEDLREATNNWSESNLLGRGGFGQVFKGEWKLLPVAVKRLRDNDDKNRELIREMCLNQYRHDNILPLYGYSLGGPEACLVYQLMAGGSLEQRLRVHGTRPYLPDEYLRSRCLSPAVDVFSYGVVILEMATALPAIDKTRPVLLLSDYMQQLASEGVDFGNFEDRILKAINNSNVHLCREFVSIGLHCTKYSRQERPNMLEVYKRLNAMEFPGKNLT
ncbi:Pelle, partial [Danaus plexippus plexippus]